MRSLIIWAVGAVSLLVNSCIKQHSGHSEPALIVSDSAAEAGEIIRASIVNARPGTVTSWKICHPIYFDTTKDGLQGQIMYLSELRDTIQVTLSVNQVPYAVLTQPMQSILKRFDPGLAVPLVPAGATDILTVRPIVNPNDSTLAFLFYGRQDEHCANTYIRITPGNLDGKIQASVNGKWVTGSCDRGPFAPLGVFFTNKYYLDGTWPLELSVNGATYSGSLKVSQHQTRFEFTWPDHRVLDMHPLKLGYFP